jgi:hypothetical protein
LQQVCEHCAAILHHLCQAVSLLPSCLPESQLGLYRRSLPVACVSVSVGYCHILPPAPAVSQLWSPRLLWRV